MHVTARGDYALRAAVALTATYPNTTSAQALADQQELPRKFLETILAELRRAGLIQAVRGRDGGYRLARDPAQMSVAAVLRAVDGPLAEVRGKRPEEVSYGGNAAHLQQLWIAVRSAMRDLLDEVTIAQVATGQLPVRVRHLASAPGAWQPR
ncbi:RrF2 family transcriptional regulator [Planosporangium mesophilum]|uniref:Rrf2 family transcriptional regulator n=1 Tax=Planosporangium mesophilum TaxID=689768 RepID=A0A8J3TAV3_9ACTN|nr:Rrf2 family transcriptional regulator [Planosporangium mesophilum]NJC85337.1 Rrf2 family transcriptional regulator [Planosporangium mesophilum]GII23198.1 Rrf2 family transcriptional regulator [Planosporangium mesophilum]